MYIKRILLFIVFAGLIAGGVFSYMVYSTLFTPNTKFEEDKTIVFIETDSDYQDLKEKLMPLLKNALSFEKAAKRKGYLSRIKGGKYALKKGMNNNDIINTLRSQNIPVKVSFNNQETLMDLAGRIAIQIEADSTELLAAFNDKDFVEGNGFTSDSKLAMYLPNSYEFFWNTSATDFRKKMLKEYKKFWNNDRLNKAKQLELTPEEVIALAAVVHKETVKIDERPRVAGVYLNRLKKGIKLQADPTVIYALKLHSGDFDKVYKRVLYKDLELDSPYNTYMYAGIPPGPITMPDISAIKAVLNPEQHDYYYFVANVEKFGYHMFAKTLAQHNRNKGQYIRWINKQKINR